MKKLIMIMMVATMLLMSACSGKSGGEGASKVDIPEAQTVLSEEITDTDKTDDTDNTDDTNETEETKSDEEESDKSDKTDDAEETEKNEKQTEKKTSSPSGSKNKSASVVLNGKTIKIGMTATDNLMSSIGQTLDVQNAPSCHYDGNDTIYVYNGFSIYTYADAGKDKIYLIEINGSNVSTAEGAKVGMTLGQIEKIYGKSTSSSASRITYSVSSNTELSFTIAGNTVVLIEYVEK